MVTINFNVHEQVLALASDFKCGNRVTDTFNYFQCKFNFDENWDGLYKRVYFKNTSFNITKSVLLAEDTCYIPNEVLAHTGVVLCSVTGFEVIDSAPVQRLTTNSESLFFTVDEGVLRPDYQGTPTPTEFEQFVGVMTDMFNDFTSQFDTDIESYIVNYIENHPSLINDPIIVEDSLAVALSNEYAVGRYILTKGFSEAGDCGGGLYVVSEKPDAFVSDDCTKFLLTSTTILERVFYQPFVYLESLNFGTAAYSTILSVISDNDLHDVRARNLSSDTTIAIGDFDFTFNKITYTGSGTALLLDGVGSNHVRGNEIKASSGTCITMTCTDRSCAHNNIVVRDLNGNYGLKVLPVNGHGVMHNYYNFGFITATYTGLYTYIPANTGYYSWQGEDVYSVTNIRAAVGVSFVIDPIDDVTVDGTITGVTFLHLAVEESTTGVYIRCGSTINSVNSDACIKSIIINNMRCRETDKTTTFLDAEGFIKDLYVKTTSAIKLSQWSMNITSYNRAFVDAPVFSTNSAKMVGYGLCSRVGQLYIKERMHASMNITTADIDLTGLATSSTLFLPDFVRAGDSADNRTLKLAYCYDESLRDLYVSVGAGRTIYVNIPVLSNIVTLDNTASADRHVFLITAHRYGNAQSDFRAHVADLGVDAQVT